MGLNKKGFTLLETLVAGLVLAIVGSGIAVVYTKQSAILAHTAHRLQAVDHLRSAADKLLDNAKAKSSYGYWTSWSVVYEPHESLYLGEHDEKTDPDICGLPDTYFKQKLNPKIHYTVDYKVIDEFIYVRYVKIIIEWEEVFPKRETKSETIYIAAHFWNSYIMNYAGGGLK